MNYKLVTFTALFLYALLFCPVRYRKLTRLQKLKIYAAEVAESYGLDYEIIHATIQWESGWRERKIEWQHERAISFGLFQNSPETTYEFFRMAGMRRRSRQDTIQWLFDGYNNIEVGCWNIWRRKKEFGCIKKALSAHNMGAGGFIGFYRRTGRPYYNRYISKIRMVLGRDF